MTPKEEQEQREQQIRRAIEEKLDDVVELARSIPYRPTIDPDDQLPPADE